MPPLRPSVHPKIVWKALESVLGPEQINNPLVSSLYDHENVITEQRSIPCMEYVDRWGSLHFRGLHIFISEIVHLQLASTGACHCYEQEQAVQEARI